MMKNNHLFYVFLLVFALVPLLAGCVPGGDSAAANGEEQAEKTDGDVQLYYLNSEENGFHTVSYSLENPDDPLLASYEVTYKLSDTESSYTNSYKPSIFDGVAVNSIVLDDGEETVDLGVGYRQLSPSKEILLRTAVVKSLVQIDGVDSVRFTINGDSLLGNDDDPIGAMTGSAFILEEDSEELYDDKQKVTLYYANMDGDGLVEYKTSLKAKDNMPMETRVLMELMNTPEDLEAQSPLPAGVVINETQIHNNVCYVDLSKDIENVLPGVEEKIMVYAMVNSVTSLGNATSVQFTVEGEKVKTLRGFESFHLLLTNDYSLSGGG